MNCQRIGDLEICVYENGHADIDRSDDDGPESLTVIPAEHRQAVALALLGPGWTIAKDGATVDLSAPRCYRCGRALTSDEINYYGNSCNSCEGEMNDLVESAAFDNGPADAS